MIRIAFRTLLLGMTLGSAVVITPAFGQTGAIVEQKRDAKSGRVETSIDLTPDEPAFKKGPVYLFSQPAQVKDSLSLNEKLAFDFVITAKNPEEELMGTSLQPVSEVQRAQIDIPAGQGLIVGGVNPNSAADRIGLKPNDILLTLGDTPLAKFDDLTNTLKTAREGNVFKLHFLRKGKKESVEVKPISVVTCGPVPKVEKSFMIGVSAGPVDEVLNAQFDGKLEGLAVNEVIAGKPAEKAGIRVGDIIVSIDDQPLTSTEQLTEKIKASKGKPMVIQYQRRDKIFHIVKVTPEPRETPVAEINSALRLYQLERQAHPELFIPQYKAYQPGVIEARGSATAADPRVAAIEKEIEGLKRQLTEIQELIKAQGKK